MSNKSNHKLINYRWTGINRHHETTSGVIEASHIIFAKNKLGSQGILVKKITKDSAGLFHYLGQTITQRDITVFYRQIATLIHAGVPIVQSCNIMSASHSKPPLSRLIHQIKHDIEAGKTLAESLRHHPHLFNELCCNLIEAGEQSGCLELMLTQCASYQEKIDSLKKKIKKALTYPLFVLAVSLLMTAMLLVFVVPQFQTILVDLGASLPTITRIMIDLSQFFQVYGGRVILLTLISAYLLIYAKNRSPTLGYLIEKKRLALPVIGNIIQHAAIARFSRTLAITLAAGLPLVEALKLVAGATGHTLYQEATQKIQEDIAKGQSLKLAIQGTLLFPNKVVQMIAIGEESGKLEHLLIKMADFYEQEVDLAVETFSSLLEPVMMLILGILVGGLVLAMYLPIFRLGSLI